MSHEKTVAPSSLSPVLMDTNTLAPARVSTILSYFQKLRSKESRFRGLVGQELARKVRIFDPKIEDTMQTLKFVNAILPTCL